MIISGAIKTRNPQLSGPGYGSNTIIYRRSLNVTNALLKSDTSGGTEIDCRCVDTNVDAICDGGCIQNPSGMGSATIIPAAIVVPTAMPPCGCGDGVVNQSLGEQSDAGSVTSTDVCRYNCTIPRCGDGILDRNEQCDDANTQNGDCCSSSCEIDVDGTACSDGNVCTQGDICHEGVCVGGGPVTCMAQDQCHVAGTCSPASGCSNPAKPNGTGCNDGNLCTTSDSCQHGVCHGISIVCSPLDLCHSPGVCSPATGTCSNPLKPDGAVCQDACTEGVCVSGASNGVCFEGVLCHPGSPGDPNRYCHGLTAAACGCY